MLRDVFYYGNKPNAHAREKYAIDLADARQQCTTEHFWIINEYCDYRKFNWDFDFEFLSDEDVWAQEHINVWPSQHQKDSGTWLCNATNNLPLIIYRADVDPVLRRNEKSNAWVILDLIDESKTDFSWHPDPTDPPYIYKWGCKFFPTPLKPVLEYHVKNATNIKYVDEVITLLPELDRWIEKQPVDRTKFDLSWRPDPREPAYIYVWGNKYISAELQSTLEYHVPGATEKKYMSEFVDVLPELDRWIEVQAIDKTKFDLSWRPDPREPAYIYVWGNKYISAELQSTLEYHVLGATEKKYMSELVEVIPDLAKWREIQPIDRTNFDLSWRPDPREPAYIYVWGNKYISADLLSTIEYHVPGATEKKYMSELVDVLPDLTKWREIQPIDRTNFDLSWRPDPREPAYIYVWGNKYISADLQSTIEYHVPNATEKKYMEELVEVLPQYNRWKEFQPIDKTKFDLSWRPDPREPAYIYVWGNKYDPAEVRPTLEYICPGATEYKYMDIVDLKPEWDRWKEIQPVDKPKFDFSWRPDPNLHEPPYIYIWGNKYISAELQSTLEYHVPGATEKKYMEELVDVLPEFNRWIEVQAIDKTKFDLLWRPDPREPAYIYVWGNKHISAELQSTLEYHVPNATEKKYMEELVEVLPELDRWVEVQSIDKTKFDLSWRPDPREPAFIYVWGNKHISAELQSTIEYHVPGATEKKYMSELVDVWPQAERWKTIQEVKNFDFTWRPDPREPAFIYVWGNKHIPGELESTIEYHVPGATEKKYMGEVDVLPEWNRYQILTTVDKNSFDFTWRPDPREPAFIYVWGNKYIHAELQSTLEYHVPGATEKKYMEELVEVLPELDRWVETQVIDRTKFDLTWRPDPTSPLYIYIWGNKHILGELQSTLEYHVPGATEKKYMEELVEVLPELDKWVEVQAIDKTKFDLSWRPDPREPAYIYVWGNKYISAELQSTLEYHVPGATEKKYMEELVEVLPELDRWVEVQTIDKSKFDLSWRPDPREPAYIYVWGNKYISADLQSTIEYHVPGATEKKYMEELVGVLPELARWVETQVIDKSKFDLSWRPDPREPAYIYVWGNKYDPAEVKSTIEYHVQGATEKKYMGIVDLAPQWDRWKEVQLVNKSSFDFRWRPDPNLHEPPYIYIWGNKHILGELQSTLEYHVPGATEKKYMEELVEVLPEFNRWVEVQAIDKSKFDLSWRPDPREPAFIYVWGNKHINADLQSTIEYHVPGATEKKYMSELVEVLPEFNRWVEVQAIDKSKFDLSWRPDPREPAYIYVWGNKYISAELQSTIEYHCPGATEKKYMKELVEVLPELDKWVEVQAIDKSKFDLSWRPDPREPAFIYVWGNKYISGELQSTIEYHVPGATEHKYLGEASIVPEWNRYQILIPVDNDSFDFTWRPDPREPAYIYVWGNQSNSAESEPTIEYHCLGATERKYVNDKVAKTLPISNNWKQLITIESFDYSWRPDPNSPPYIYVFGNQWHDAMTEPTLEYHVEGAKDKKFVTDIIATVRHTPEHWKTLITIESFDYSWRPNPHSKPYIYVFGNQWNDSVNEPTIEYHQPDATDKKYITDIVATVKSTSTESYWKRLIPIESFDYSWRPDPNSPPYIYVFGNKWNDATTEPSIEYHVLGATEYKYITAPVAIPQSNISLWSINNNDDLETFDFTWRPNPHSPPQIYQWADNGPRYTMPAATDVVFVEHTSAIRKTIVNRYKIKTTLEDLIQEHTEEVFWAINPDLSYNKFDFSWRPNEENFRHVNVFGNEHSMNTQTYYVNGPLYIMGYKEFNYVEEQTVEIDSNLSMFYIDRNNNENNERFNALKVRYPNIQKTRYLNTWVDTINRCINKSETKLFWILNSELDYSEFEFDFYPSPWQEKMVHVFGTQWSHWGTTFMINKETFAEDTKYVKIIEHLSNLNFVKAKRAIASNCLYDVYLIDYENDSVSDTLSLIKNKTKSQNIYTIKYENDYLTTLKNILYELDIKKDHYIWVCGSICDYTNFDFTYICDPFSLKQLHVFPSDKQKFGDTFFINVNDLRIFLEGLDKLENIAKINFNQHQRVKRLPAPNFITESDTHVSITNTDFNWPYATFVTTDHKEINVVDHEPISMWSKEAKNILITSTGGTRIIVPKEAKVYIDSELYDYPYINKSSNLVKSKPLDIVFLSNGETGADANYEYLLSMTKGLPNRVVRVDGINGRVASYHAAANISETPWMFTVFAKLRVNDKFDWSWQPDRLQVAKHYIFNATNPVNGLVYGHQAMIAYNKKITLNNSGKGLDFTLDDEHEVVDMNSGIAMYNTDAFSTWRTSFREAIKLRADDSQASKDRLDAWLNIGAGDYAQYSCEGAQHAVEYYESVNGELDKLRLSYDWPWLKEYFNAKYN